MKYAQDLRQLKLQSSSLRNLHVVDKWIWTHFRVNI